MSEIFDDIIAPTTEELATWALNASSKELTFLSKVINVRRKALREMANAIKEENLYVGDSVQLSYQMRPKKIAGKKGKIEEIKYNQKTGNMEFVIKIDELIEGWPRVRVQAALLTKI